MEKDGLHYGLVSRLNHWLVAVVFIGMLCFGFFLSYGGLTPEVRRALMPVHKSIGTLFLVYASWRVLWRLIQGFPKDISATPPWQHCLARVVHWLLLISVVSMPLSGVVMSLYGGRSIDVFGWFTLPAQAKTHLVSRLAHEIHEIAPLFIVALVLLHISAALKHHFLDKDNTLRRMLGHKFDL